NQSALKKSLDLVVDSCVNSVGVDLNTASYHLLSRVSGIGPSLAKKVVDYRAVNGLFRTRDQLLEIPRFSKKTFEQAAGFLRIPGGDQPLDNTGVHPERYPVLEKLATEIGKQVSDLLGHGVEFVKQAQSLREELGGYTFDDIVRELEKPGRDPREEFAAFEYRDDIHEISDLQPGMICPGIVTNVTNFGAFVDIGVHQDGLVHISQLSNRFVKEPRDVVNPGDRVKVKVLEINLEKNQIALTMKTDEVRTKEKKPDAQVETHGTPGDRGKKKDIKKDTRQDQQKRAPAKGAFNNPFASLADWRDKKKS
ncbi:MAG: helix-hairpin-helix domain-containing protein, partial [Blastocatellia bacterium]|nr:helix-hairpin-helix domain-containing protein [Blastocatellia bacterium]